MIIWNSEIYPEHIVLYTLWRDEENLAAMTLIKTDTNIPKHRKRCIMRPSLTFQKAIFFIKLN